MNVWCWYVFGNGLRICLFVCMSGDMFGRRFASVSGDGMCLAVGLSVCRVMLCVWPWVSLYVW